MSDSISRLYQAALACRHDDPSTSRTARLLRSGRSKMAKKLAEEAVEVVIAAVENDRTNLINESADVLFHLMVLLKSRGITIQEVEATLGERTSQSGLQEKASRKSE